MTFEDFLMWNKIRPDETDLMWLAGAQYAFENREKVISMKNEEIDKLKKECEQLRAALYKAYDYIHEGTGEI